MRTAQARQFLLAHNPKVGFKSRPRNQLPSGIPGFDPARGPSRLHPVSTTVPIQQPNRTLDGSRAQVHIALRRGQVSMSRQLLDRPRRRTVSVGSQPQSADRERLRLQIADSVAANLLASRRGLLRSLEGAERQLVHFVDDLCVRARRRLQAGPRARSAASPGRCGSSGGIHWCRRRAGTGRTSSCRSPVASDSGRDPASRRTA